MCDADLRIVCSRVVLRVVSVCCECDVRNVLLTLVSVAILICESCVCDSCRRCFDYVVYVRLV